MSDPVWRIKSRPCQYYRKGTCLFGDSCNFVHSDVWSPLETTLVDTPQKTEFSQTTPKKKSHRDSARLNELLHALKDVIGQEEQPAEDNGLLSPMSDVSGLHLTGLRIDTPDPLDSGYESWHTPEPLVLSPPRSPSVASTIELLVSPFGSPSARLMTALGRDRISPLSSSLHSANNDDDEIDCSPPGSEVYARPQPATSRMLSSEIPKEDEIVESDGTTSRWDSEDNPTMVYLGTPSPDEIATALQQENDRPLHHLSDDESLELDDDDAQAHSSFSEEDNTAHLEYLRDSSFSETKDDDDTIDSFFPQQKEIEDDTINSLYNVYSSDTEEDTPTPNLPSQVSPSQQVEAMNPPQTPLRERVFTPPPIQERRPSVAKSSPKEPLISSTEQKHIPPPLNLAPKSPVSTKVPFGFRSASPGLTHAKNPSVFAHRRALKEIAQSSPPNVQRFSVPEPADTELPKKGLRPLRLSTLITNTVASSSSSTASSSPPSSALLSSSSPSYRRSRNLDQASPVISSSSNTPSSSLFNAQISPISIPNSHHGSGSSIDISHSHEKQFNEQTVARGAGSRSASAIPFSKPAWTSAHQHQHHQSLPMLSIPASTEEDEEGGDDRTIRLPMSADPPVKKHESRAFIKASVSAPVSASDSKTTIARPTLLFAIASDDPAEVEQALSSSSSSQRQAGSDADSGGLNEAIGPNDQSALLFTLMNDQLRNKLPILKILLGFGADPAPCEVTLNEVDQASRYYLARALNPLTHRLAALMQRSPYRALTRLRYEIVGQERMLEQLFRVLSMHRPGNSPPLVLLLCGPSGLGKSLLAHRFGPVLGVPTHTVNMTTLRSAHDLWQSYSIEDEDSQCTLLEFLTANQGKQCVVVLDEIEKTEDRKALWSLLVPWEIGRCSFEASSPAIDVRKVIWLATSNIGHDTVSDYCRTREKQDELISRNEYVELTGLIRHKVLTSLGESVLSRLTTILPFVPFSLEEKRTIATEAVLSMSQGLACSALDAVVEAALAAHHCEDARSLFRAVSNHLVDAIDL